jgi:hypothetical protein
VQSEDAVAWRTKIEEVRSWTAEHRANFIGHAMQRAREVFSWDRVADDVLKAYEAALDG